MAVEVDIQNYAFKTKEPPEFQYNVLHDLESLWWVAVYFVINKNIVPTSQNIDGNWQTPVSDAHYDYAAQLLQHVGRTQAIVCRGWFKQRLEVLPPTILPIAKLLEDLRIHLVTAYAVLESTDTPDSNAVHARGLHEQFASIFRRIAEDAQDLTATPLQDDSDDSDVMISRKRGRSELEREISHAEPVPPSKRVKIGKKRQLRLPSRPYLPRRAKQQHIGG